MLQIYDLILNNANTLLYFFYGQRLVAIVNNSWTMGDKNHRFIVIGENILQEVALCSEQGGGLSEGQAQRIAIARSLLQSSLLPLHRPYRVVGSHGLCH